MELPPLFVELEFEAFLLELLKRPPKPRIDFLEDLPLGVVVTSLFSESFSLLLLLLPLSFSPEERGPLEESTEFLLAGEDLWKKEGVLRTFGEVGV